MKFVQAIGTRRWNATNARATGMKQRLALAVPTPLTPLRTARRACMGGAARIAIRRNIACATWTRTICFPCPMAPRGQPPSGLSQKVSKLLPDLLAGKAGEKVVMPLSLLDVNADLFSPGRQHLAQETLDDLLAGFVDTGVDPATGENR